MKKVIYPIMAAVILVSSAFVTATSADEFKLKSGSKIAFKSKDPNGEFKTVKGTVKFDEADLAGSKFELTFEVASISTGNGMQNKKAQTEEWFNAAKYPNIKFVSTKIEKSGSDYSVTGNLSMKGATKAYKVPLKVAKSGTDLTFIGTFNVKRSDFKVGKSSDAVPDVMSISYSIPVTKK
ncbi:MAG: YceI family protein [Fluviicola sp.]|nr:YceI family protein [Fluviicola sp.]